MNNLVNLLFEMQHLKQVKHEGWRMAGVHFPDSVGEHSLCAAQIGMVLAILEGLDPAKVASMLIWHDSAETRIGDLHKTAVNYISGKKEAEKKVTKDQLSIEGLEYIKELVEETYAKTSPESIVAKDADYLEMAFQAKIYTEQGYAAAQDWLDRIGPVLKTKSAQEIFAGILEAKSYDWRKEGKLKKIVE